jgi:very-short-patch-repair endonuclease
MECFLWELLRDRRLDGMKFRRQVPIGPFVVDFACLEHRLIVEADGPLHDPIKDAERDAWLVGQGFQVVRFRNGLIENCDWGVKAAILAAVNRPTARTPHPSACGGHLLPQGEKDR